MKDNFKKLNESAFIGKVKKHAPWRSVLQALGVMIIVSWGTSSMAETYVATYEKVMPSIDAFEYQGVTKNFDSIDKETPPTFESVSEFKIDGKVEWFDTMRCEQDGGLKKYKTQYWADYKLKGVMKATLWTYSADLPDATADKCKMCGTVVMTTSRGYKKEWSYCTDLWNTDI